jgi:hypothetical protein
MTEKIPEFTFFVDFKRRNFPFAGCSPSVNDISGHGVRLYY